jgi:hypothetical protein
MIYFNINIRNPWRKDSTWETLYTNFGSAFIKNKYWEVQCAKSDNILRLEFAITHKQDHAGINLELALFGYEVHFRFYDGRHWNYVNNSYD